MKTLILVLILFGIAFLVPISASAFHSWGGYHWARTSNPFTLPVGDNVTGVWDPVLTTSISDWSVSSVLDLSWRAGGTSPKPCRATSGRVEVCAAKYGKTGWLGIAQIWVTGLHITQGIVKNNDTYFSTATYNTTPWRNLVMCQEIGHSFGLDHQDEDFSNANLNTCMDYTSDPESNQHPNAHDYEELENIYAHLDSTSTVGFMPVGAQHGELNSQSDWGRAIKDNGKVALFERELGMGNKLVTFVIWAE